MSKIDKLIVRILLLICEILARHSEKVYTHEIAFLKPELKELD